MCVGTPQGGQRQCRAVRWHDSSFQNTIKRAVYTRKELYANVVLLGGTTILRGIIIRMTLGLSIDDDDEGFHGPATYVAIRKSTHIVVDMFALLTEPVASAESLMNSSPAAEVWEQAAIELHRF